MFLVVEFVLPALRFPLELVPKFITEKLKFSEILFAKSDVSTEKRLLFSDVIHLIKPCVPNALFLYPLKTSKYRKIF